MKRMSKATYKKQAILLITFLIAILATTIFLNYDVAIVKTSPSPSLGSYWLSGWDYRKSHVITNASGAGRNYQVRVKVFYGSQGKMKYEVASVGTPYESTRPNAIYYNGKTYFTWLNREDKTIRIQTCDHSTKSWGSIYTIATTSNDDIHRGPAIGILPNQTLIVFYGCHNDDLRWKVSENAEDESSWGTEQSRAGSYTYPQVMSFSDKIVIFFRKIGTTWYKDSHNGTAWSGETLFSGSVAGRYYWWFTKIGSRIFMAGCYEDTGPPPERINVYFAYSEDKGETWKKADGTSLAVPMAETAKILDSGYRTTALPVLLDENNKPIIGVVYQPNGAGDFSCKLAVYSVSLGEVGGWSLRNIVDQDGNQVYGGDAHNDFVNLFLSNEVGNGRPTFWLRTKDGSNYYMKRYNRQSGQLSTFDLTHSDTYANVTEYACTTEIWDAVSSEFEVLSGEKTNTYRTLYVRGVDIHYGDEVYVYGHSRTDFGDIRFTDYDGITLLDYWMKEKVDGDYAIFWVKLAHDLSSDQTIYMYYGKSDATTTSVDSKEDFTTYTWNNGHSHLSRSATRVTATNLPRDVDEYLYANKGTDHFDDFEHLIDVNLIGGAGDGLYAVWALWNVLDDYWGAHSANEHGIGVVIQNAGNKIFLMESHSGTLYNTEYYGITPGTTYYLTIEKIGTTLTCKIYSDSARTNLLDTLQYTLHASTKWCYLYSAQSWNDGAVAKAVSGYCENLYLSRSVPHGSWGTEDYFIVTLYGVYDEDLGTLKSPNERAVNVTTYFTDGTPPDTFEVNGTLTRSYGSTPAYLVFAVSKERQYWITDGEKNIVVYIFDADLTTYTIEFLDLAGITEDRPFVEAKYYINGTLRTVEKRKVDVEPKIMMNLVNGRKYLIQIKDGASYTFGDLLMTSTTTIQLTLKQLDLPDISILGYTWVNIHCERAFGNPNGTITVTYNDTKTATTQVFIEAKYRNGTQAYNGTETTNTFTHTWSYALNNTDYRVEATITHQSLGTLTAKWFLSRELSEAPWTLDFLGNLPFSTTVLIPVFIVLCFAGLFSALNAPLGAFVVCIVTILFVYMGWLDISGGVLIAGIAFAIMFAIIYAKRRANV